MTMKTRLSAAYKGVYALLMAQGARDWINDEPINMATFLGQQIDIHHIFPKKWCTTKGIDEDRRESIVNKTPIAYSTNRAIGGSAPSEYIPRVKEKAGLQPAEFDELIEAHAIDAGALHNDDFPAFFSARWESLLALIGQAMGKEAVRDDLTDADASAYEAEPEDSEDDEITDESPAMVP
jgi:hypothetical protein